MREKPKAGETNNYTYNKWLQPFVNNLRKKMTKAEACMGKYALRTGRIKGCQFRRQRPARLKALDLPFLVQKLNMYGIKREVLFIPRSN
ncbi:MAG: hypothetical protein HS132_09450 [Planctomycetia bacterium]|nr:hypothetical protein [Planctomycetia bacterium]